ncbi:sacsin N-terminal ATP-binding-like domain-containing protein [Microbacterium allomyrinae]|uniref:DEAD/DEAH box helicase family protein n=1 Tax=Microbacterium allomyrinae TaxID=2830666 RepID=A0A9X1S0S9_9MICO|nr:DEAD/DEAH box helicase family protein [Microbacterium allomyrinae]MCC2030896.1 DEAD/DEAH box helicase family protein [Microbacterium allomyrinae]
MADSTTTWEPDPALILEIEDQFDRAIGSYKADPKLVIEHANLEESIRVGGYANRTLLELVQNAADAMAGTAPGEDKLGRVEIVLDPATKTLYCANSGRPFSKSGLEAMSHAYLSAKRGDEIGRFGLGFKSVLALTDFPQVLSRSVSFEYNSPTATDAIRAVGSAARRLPILRTATPLDAQSVISDEPLLRSLAGWATTIVRLPGVRSIERLEAEMRSFASEFLLFVSAVREVHLRVLGDEGFETSHISRDLGDGLFKIERPDGSGDEWIVGERMHAPSPAARREVGEAVSRDEIKVSVAIPLKPRRSGTRDKDDRGTQIGQFWSYFPLQDNTSATGFFNAPWSVNDDRTTLLRNGYNREILSTMADLFIELVPRVSTEDDRAAHLDYLPARGREERSYGDSILCTDVPRLAGSTAIVPDSTGALRFASELVPLDFGASDDLKVDEAAHKAWIESPNTGADVPHWKCYTSNQRTSRLSEVFAATADPELFFEEAGPRARRIENALKSLPKRGILSWLLEWADGSHIVSSANAFRFTFDRRTHPTLSDARVIPTSGGFKGLRDKDTVFLRRAEDLEIEGAQFVEAEFLAHGEMERSLRECGFRDLDPVAILNARITKLTPTADTALQSKFWDAVVGVSTREAMDVIAAHPLAVVLVPTRDGGWAWPQQVVDLDEALPAADGRLLLERDHCLPVIAHALGVVRAPRENFPFEDEFAAEAYQEAVIAELNSRLSQGDRPIERIALYPRKATSPGPFSVLLLLAESAASESVREQWTRGLLEFGDDPWDCEDSDTGASYSVSSPVRWAVDNVGMLKSSRGYRRPGAIVSGSLIKFDGLLPLFRGPRQVEDALGLPDELDSVPADVLQEALEHELYPPALKDDVLAEFTLHASRIAYPTSRPQRIPARVHRAIESRPPNSVYLASTDEQEVFLQSRQRPYLRVTPDDVDEFVESLGCRRFEDSFSFSMVVEGQQEPQRILDTYTGLRSEFGSKLGAARCARALQIAKRVTTEEGVEDQALDWHLDGSDLVVRSDADERQTLAFVSDAFDLRLNNAQLSQVLKAGLDHRLELLRKQAQSIESDAERLDHYIGPDDLKDALPTGLWSALQAQELVDDETSVAELFLTVYGSDSLRILSDRFREEGYSDVPTAWAGTSAAISWVRKMGFGPSFAGQRNYPRPEEFVVAGAVRLNKLHSYQKKISEDLRTVLTQPSAAGPAQKGMVELPTGAGKTRVATETVLRLFADEVLRGTVLWIAQSAELCEQAVQTFQAVWRYLGDERPLTIGRLWDTNTVHEPDTELSVVVATDAKIEAIMNRADYEWLKRPTAVFIDEAHRAGGSTRYTTILRWLGVDGRSWERPLVGLSATPFKGSASETSGTKELVARFGSNRLAAFKSDSYRQLVNLGVLANVRHEVLDTGVDVQLSTAERTTLQSTRLIDRNLYERIGRNEHRMRVLVEHILQQDPTWPILVFTPSVLSAQVLAASLNYRRRGVRAASVSGQTGRQERRNVIERFQAGEIQVLANCDLLVQGFDAPGVRALYIARPTFSPGAYIQMAGRGLRGKENGGKEECLIVDVADNWGAMNDFLGYHDYEDLWQEQGQ